ncbi:glycosyltransferase family 4 protein [Lactococcus lactis]|uniref:glycosyltransferase family 4 protein n=1 Tax=Lactococcus lactis TaxID=1358 RepID=UPI003219FD72
MKTIAFFNGFYLPHFGGVERYTYNIGQNLISKGYRVIVITSQHNSNLPLEETIDGIKIYRLPIKNIWRERYPFLLKNQNYRNLIKKIEEEPIDHFVVNTRFYMTSLLGVELAAKRGKKAIVIEHGSSYLTLGNPLLDKGLRQVERYLIKKIKLKTDLFYGVSKEAANWLIEFNIKGKGVLYNAVNQEDFKKYHQENSKGEKIIISYSGRLIPKIKGVEILLSVFEQLTKEFNNLELVIAGSGSLQKTLKKKYKQKNIKFLGFVTHDKVMEVNALSDIFVLMSRSEGFSTAMLEAGLLGNVIITTPTVGGAHDVVPDETYGYIIENDEQKLLTTLRTLLLNKIKINEIKKKVSRRILENFTWIQTTESFIKVFEEMED